jgi:hypothetical protein
VKSGGQTNLWVTFLPKTTTTTCEKSAANILLQVLFFLQTTTPSMTLKSLELPNSHQESKTIMMTMMTFLLLLL